MSEQDQDVEHTQDEDIVSDRKLPSPAASTFALAGHALFDYVHEGIIVTDRTGVIIEVNQPFTRITGYSRAEAVGLNPRFLASGHPDEIFYETLWEELNQQGLWRGEVWNRHKDGSVYPQWLTILGVRNEAGEITHYVGIFSDPAPAPKNRQRRENVAGHDLLSDLPNRSLLYDRLRQAQAQADRHRRQMAVCYVDIEKFKTINDTYGYPLGDDLLSTAARRMCDSIRSGDTVAHLKGDEFVLLLTDMNSPEELDNVLLRLLDSLSAPYHLTQATLSVAPTIGATLYPRDHADADTLVSHAGQAMRIARQAGGSGYRLFDMEQERRAHRHGELQRNIAQGLAHREFTLYFQPKVNMSQGRVIGAEALLRWNHPERGLLLPDEFLSEAVASDVIVKLGNWVLRETLTQIRQWCGEGLRLPVSVNVSARQLQRADFNSQLAAMLAEFPDVPPNLLELEILETAALEDSRHVSLTIQQCRDMGIRVSLDDFGTGYSSLSYLKRLPIDALKIDRSFVRDMLDNTDDMTIVEGIVGLGKAFGRQVIAEGVETPSHCILLIRLGCELGQGFGIAPPMPGERIPDWYRAYQPNSSWRITASQRWNRLDFPLFAAETEHLGWLQDLLRSLEDRAPWNPPPQALDHHACRFGQWYAGQGAGRYARLREFQDIEPAHRAFHETLARLAALCKAGQTETARALAAQLQDPNQAFLRQIDRLQQVLLA